MQHNKYHSSFRREAGSLPPHSTNLVACKAKFSRNRGCWSGRGREKSDSEDEERAEDMSERSPSAGRGAAFAAGLVAGCSIAILLLAADTHRRRRREQRDVGGSSSSSSYDQRHDPSDELSPPSSSTHRPLPPEIRSEMLSRNSPIFHL